MQYSARTLLQYSCLFDATVLLKKHLNWLWCGNLSTGIMPTPVVFVELLPRLLCRIGNALCILICVLIGVRALFGTTDQCLNA